MNTIPLRRLTQQLRQYTGQRKLSDLHTQVLIELRTGDKTLEDLAAKTKNRERSVLSACLLLNSINLCWWTDDDKPRYYLTAEGQCMLNEMESNAIV